MGLKFTTTKKSSEYTNVLVYGLSGVGKTVLCSTAPKPIIISSESGLLSIAEFDFPVIIVKNLQDLEEAFDFVSSKTNKYSTVCKDSITDIAESVLGNLKKECKDPRQAYGQLNDSVSEVIREFRDLPMNSYFIAQSQTYESAAGNQCLRPSMPGKTLTNSLPFFFDEVLCLRIGETEDGESYRYLQTQPSLSCEAKDRSGRLKKIERPDLKKLFKKIRG